MIETLAEACRLWRANVEAQRLVMIERANQRSLMLVEQQRLKVESDTARRCLVCREDLDEEPPAKNILTRRRRKAKVRS